MTTAEIVRQCKSQLAKYYGAKFKGLILYGSVARNQANPASDIDLLVLLGQPFEYFTELKNIIDVLYPIQLESERLISAKPASLDDFEKPRVQFYRNAKREGIAI